MAKKKETPIKEAKKVDKNYIPREQVVEAEEEAKHQ